MQRISWSAVVVLSSMVLRGAIQVPLVAADDPVQQLILPGDIAVMLTPQPQQITCDDGHFSISNSSWVVRLPQGGEHGACRSVLTTSLQQAGATIQESQGDGHQFVIGEPVDLPDLPVGNGADEAYVLRVTSTGVTARGASPAGLLYAAQTLRQLLRIYSARGRLPCLTIVDSPRFPVRGLYIEGGQERFGRIVAKEYLLDQIRRLSEFKMNTLVIECYNLFPFTSFPACADAATLSEADCDEIVRESKRWHVTIVPSLQTLAQAHELVWTSEEGVPYREATAPGLMCPSNPDLYPFIQRLYRDLLNRFDEAPVIGIGCSEIDMQWTERYCPACRRRINAGETVRDLLLGHAEQCIAAVQRVSAELGRPVRPLMWADEFYMYGPGKDWVGIERISRDTVMGYWKYWADYSGIDGLLERGYDVLGISAMYNHTFYLADLSPDQPAKLWPPMEQTGTRNITAMLNQAAQARGGEADGRFWGVATASFSKHRLRAFDSIWYGFALNGHAAWGRPRLPLVGYQEAFTAAFARHFFDARTDEAAHAIAAALVRLDHCKSALELANQSLGDVVGVVDTQEPGYLGNTLPGALRRCGQLMAAGGDDRARVMTIREAARQVVQQSQQVLTALDGARPQTAREREWAELRLAGEKIGAHAERQILLIDTQQALLSAADQSIDRVREIVADLPQRWAAHRERMTTVLEQSQYLSVRGDPLGLVGLLADVARIESHLRHVAPGEGRATSARREILLEERFECLDATRWIVLGDPQVVNGRLETLAPGGWENYSGLATRQTVDLDASRPLVIEFELTPLTMGVDSQLLASANEMGTVSYRFSFYGPGARFGIYTQSTTELAGPWESVETGWKPRAHSPAVEVNTEYRVRAELTRTTWRVTLGPSDTLPLQLPLWDSGAVPMDELTQTRLVFADVEPAGSTAASRWGPITIWRE